MKIWEIEEGREFIDTAEKGSTVSRKIIEGRLYLKKLGIRGSYYKVSDALFNDVFNREYEYLPEKKYYLKLKPEMKFTDEFSYLVYAEFKEKFFISYNWKGAGYHTKFTEKEIEELIPPLWLTVCDRMEVGNES